MSNSDLRTNESSGADDELLNFEFDDLSLDDVETSGTNDSADDEVIELVDMVEEGDLASKKLPDTEEKNKKATAGEADDLAGTVDASIPIDLESELDAALDGLEPALEEDPGQVAEEESTTDEIASLLDEVELVGGEEAADDAAEKELSADVGSELTAELEGLGASDLDLDAIEASGQEKEKAEIDSPKDAGIQGKAVGEEPVDQELTRSLEDDLDFALDELESSVSELEASETAQIQEIDSPGTPEKALASAPEKMQATSEPGIEASLEGLEPSDLEIEEIEGIIGEEEVGGVDDLFEQAETPEADKDAGLVEAETAPEIDDIGAIEMTSDVRETIPGQDFADEMQGAEKSQQREGSGLELLDGEIEDAPDLDTLREENLDLESAAADVEFAEGQDRESEVGMTPISPEEIGQISDMIEENSGGEELAPQMGSISLSEEKIEAIITTVVEGVVERVARETMAAVAEKVIREAIEELKQSMELSQE